MWGLGGGGVLGGGGGGEGARERQHNVLLGIFVTSFFVYLNLSNLFKKA